MAQACAVKPVVLMVDDEPDFVSVVRLWAEPQFTFLSLNDGEDLLEEAAAVRPDLVVLDVSMPGPDGFELCRRLRADKRFSGVPVLFLTGRTRVEDFVSNISAGGTAFLNKPVGRRRLLSVMSDLTGCAAEESFDTGAAD